MTRRALLLTLAPATGVLRAADTPWKADELTFRSKNHGEISLAKLRGKVVAVMFFSTDCPHCQTTAEMLGPVYDQYKPKGFEILALAINPSAAGNLPQFIANHRVKFPAGLGTRSQWTKFAKLPVMGQSYVPHLLLVDRDGVVQENHPGGDREFWMDQENKLRQSIEKLLAAKSAS